MAAIVFLAIGALLVGVGTLFDRAALPVPGTICLHLGIVTLAVVLLDLVWLFCGGQPIDHEVRYLGEQILRLSKSIDVIESSQQVGLEAVYSKLGTFGKQDDWVRLVNTAMSEVDLMGRSLFGWTRAAEVPDTMIERVIKQGVRFRILLMSPANIWLDTLTEDRVNLGRILIDKITVSIDFFIEVRSRLPEPLREMMQIRCFSDNPLYCGLVRIDDRLYVTQYLLSASSDNDPFYCVHGLDKEWPRTLKREFDEIWRDATPVGCAVLITTD
jgi:hypothetical protein